MKLLSNDLDSTPHYEDNYGEPVEGGFYVSPDLGYTCVAVKHPDSVLTLVWDRDEGCCAFYEYSVEEFRDEFPYRVLVKESVEQLHPELRRN